MTEDRPLKRGDLVRLRNLGSADDSTLFVERRKLVDPVYLLVQDVYQDIAQPDLSAAPERGESMAQVCWFNDSRDLRTERFPVDLLIRVRGIDDPDPSVTFPDPSEPTPGF